jgi:hypothetical protein
LTNSLPLSLCQARSLDPLSSEIPACYDHGVNLYNTLSGAVAPVAGAIHEHTAAADARDHDERRL